MKQLIALALTLSAVVGYAQDRPESARERGAFGCAPLDLSQGDEDLAFSISTHFSELQRSAVHLNTKFCDALNNPVANDLPVADLAAFGLFAEVEANSMFRGTGEQADVAAMMRTFAVSLNRGEAFPTTMPDVEIIEPDDLDDQTVAYSVTVEGVTPRKIAADSDLTCIPTSNVTCSNLIRDLDHAIRPYKRSYQIYVTDKNRQLLTGLQSDWNDFFENGRSMTTLDLIVTSFFEKDHMRQGFIVGPVKRQWFALHPNVILQYTEDVPKGDRFEPGLSIEWFGVNFWQDSFIGIPLGASLTSVYNDRADLDSIGHGLSLHFDNRYTIGWTKHGGDDAFHVSADLLQLFTEKESEFRKYKEKVLSLK